MSQFGATTKNPPWVRTTAQTMATGVTQQQQQQLQTQMMGQTTMVANPTMVQYQQPQQVFQTPMGMQQAGMTMTSMTGAMGATSVAMPTALGGTQIERGEESYTPKPDVAINQYERHNNLSNTSAEANEMNQNSVIIEEVPDEGEKDNTVVPVHENSDKSSDSARDAIKKRYATGIVSDTYAKRRKTKTTMNKNLSSRLSVMDIEIAIKKKELKIKETEHRKRCNILDIEEQIKLKELERQEYESKIKELEYKMKLKQFEESVNE